MRDNQGKCVMFHEILKEQNAQVCGKLGFEATKTMIWANKVWDSPHLDPVETGSHVEVSVGILSNPRLRSQQRLLLKNLVAVKSLCLRMVSTPK